MLALGNGRWATRNVNPYAFAIALRGHIDKRKRDYQLRRAKLALLEGKGNGGSG